MNLNNLTTQASEMIYSYGPKFIGAIVVLIIGLWIIKGISAGFKKLLKKREIDESLRPFLISLTNMLLRLLLIITVLGMLGIEMTSFIAILGAAGLAVGMALSGTLQNFAGGVMILIFKPFKVGDFIEAQGYTGTVNKILIFNTILKTPDNKTIIIPNGGLSNASMVNYSTEETRRVDFVFGIGYGDKVKDARNVLTNIINSDNRILKDPEPLIVLSELGDNSVNLTMRVWAASQEYWNVYFETTEKVYEEFGKSGLNIPFPQMDVHLHKVN